MKSNEQSRVLCIFNKHNYTSSISTEYANAVVRKLRIHSERKCLKAECNAVLRGILGNDNNLIFNESA